jgi:hypothetical protein
MRLLFPFALLCLIASGCGSTDSQDKDPVEAVPASARTAVASAQDVDAKSFPTPRAGETLEGFAQQFNTTEGPQAVAATSIFTPPETRLAFGLLDAGQKFAYGDTVVYVQKRGAVDAPISGPIPAPADVLVTEKRYQSEQAASESDPFAAIYETQVPVPDPGIYNILVVSDVDGKRIAAPLAIQVRSKEEDEIPDVGEPAPKVATDTLASLKGNEALLDTRLPPTTELAEKSFGDVVGKHPVALLFATPQLCQSRVCGPVTDEMLQLKAEYGDDMTFIHQEVYNENLVEKGLREPLMRFGLPSEPWLFTVSADGKIAARLEGSIGLRAFENAIKAALEK